MAILTASVKNIYSRTNWEVNAPNETTFETTEGIIPASNLTAERDNSQQAMLLNGTVTGIVLHVPVYGYNECHGKYQGSNNLNECVYPYDSIYYVNSEDIVLPTEVGGSVSGRLEPFRVVNQMTANGIMS